MTVEDWLANHHEITTLSLPLSIIGDNTYESIISFNESRTFKRNNSSTAAITSSVVPNTTYVIQPKPPNRGQTNSQ